MLLVWIRVAALLGLSGVLLGAFGAHGLRGRVDAAQLASWQTAVSYQLFHSVALLALALFESATRRALSTSLGLFTAGITLFSGSIYLLVLTPWHWLGFVTPLGGLLLMAGWASLLVRASEARR
jgi:uncharacterized membrane protein YgdD (TMEM256/DUF423 family)